MRSFIGTMLGLLVVPLLPAQTATDQDPAKAIAAAESTLAAGSASEQLAAVQSLLAAPRAGDSSSKIARALGKGLASPHPEVVAASLRALLSYPDRSGANAALASHLARLRKELDALPLPQWPMKAAAKMFGDSSAPKRESPDKLEQRLAQEAAEREKIRTASLPALEQAREREAALAAATDRLVGFLSQIRDRIDDSLVDEAIKDLDASFARCTPKSGPIIDYLCSSGRRDAVAACLVVMTGGNRSHSTWMVRDQDRLIAEGLIGQNRGTANDDDFRVWLAAVRQSLQDLGQRHGVPVPSPPGKSARPEEYKRDKQDWQTWFRAIEPKLARRQATK